jgi:hypothetical protein
MADIKELRRSTVFHVLRAMYGLSILACFVWWGWAISSGRIVITITADPDYVCGLEKEHSVRLLQESL